MLVSVDPGFRAPNQVEAIVRFLLSIPEKKLLIYALLAKIHIEIDI
jgi:hypothetical protein